MRKLTYLKLTGVKVGLLINFNLVVFKPGLKRLVHIYTPCSPCLRGDLSATF